ncbi:hypothetical protein B0A49_02034 [Cryomyces minteri]|uniref:Uncharacterized protein n=1 Tax=Cryomyces minteri TaxID=331657 RepID=A0A4U0XHU8_9PEZI|nr:hypothetical protein B0A49_02034 [Cryomyces minteri]
MSAHTQRTIFTSFRPDPRISSIYHPPPWENPLLASCQSSTLGLLSLNLDREFLDRLGRKTEKLKAIASQLTRAEIRLSATMATKSAPDFTPREEELMAKIWLCMKTAPEIDFKLLATHMDCAPKTVSNLWGKVKNKLGLPPVTPGAKAEASTKKTTADVDEGSAVAEVGDSDEAANGNGFTAINAVDPVTHKKTPKRSPAKRKMKDAATTTAEGEGDDEADADVTPKKCARKTPVKKAIKTEATAKEGDGNVDFEASQIVAVDEGIAFQAVHEEEDVEGVPMTDEEALPGMAAPFF